MSTPVVVATYQPPGDDAAVREQRPTRAQHQRVNQQFIRVHQLVADQRRLAGVAAEHRDAPAGLLCLRRATAPTASPARRAEFCQSSGSVNVRDATSIWE